MNEFDDKIFMNVYSFKKINLELIKLFKFISFSKNVAFIDTKTR